MSKPENLPKSKDNNESPAAARDLGADAARKSEGVMRSFVTLGTGLTHSAIDTIFGGVDDVRTNALSRARSVIDWLDANQQANIDIARRLTERTDELSRTLLESTRQALSTVVTTTRETGHGAADVASRSVSSLLSKVHTQAA